MPGAGRRCVHQELPGGFRQKITSIPANQFLTIDEDRGIVARETKR
jgi:hypothetical protein